MEKLYSVHFMKSKFSFSIFLITLLNTFLHIVNCVCVFGNQDGCLLPCHCLGEGLCDSNTGKCFRNPNSCVIDETLAANNPDNSEYWGSDACQTGNIATGKTASQIGTYYNPGFKINATADKAIDGNSSTYAYSRLRSNSDTAWWLLDLGILHVVQKAFILSNNLGNSLIKLENYTFWVGNTSATFEHILCGSFPSPLKSTSKFGQGQTGWNWNPVTCQNNMIGRYVSIRKATHDTNKQWLPLQEVAVIGYPASTVHLGRCLQHAPNKYPNLLNLQCRQCIKGWLEPDCRIKTSIIISTTSTSDDNDDDDDDENDVDEDDDSTTVVDGIDKKENEKSESLSIVIIIVIVILGIFTLISAVVIPILCIKLRHHKRNAPSAANQSNTSGLYNKEGESGYMDLERGYEPLQRDKIYLGMNSGNPNQVGYYTTPNKNQNMENPKVNAQNPVSSTSYVNKDPQTNDGYMIPNSAGEGTYTLPKDNDYYDDAESAAVYSTIDDAIAK